MPGFSEVLTARDFDRNRDGLLTDADGPRRTVHAVLLDVIEQNVTIDRVTKASFVLSVHGGRQTLTLNGITELGYGDLVTS